MNKSERLTKLITLIDTDTFTKRYGTYHVGTFRVDRSRTDIKEELVLAGQRSDLKYLEVTVLPKKNQNNNVVCIKWIYEDGKQFEAYRGFEGSTLCMGESLIRTYDIVADAMPYFSFGTTFKF